MYSGLGEYIEFSTPISPFQIKEGGNGQLSVRNIEDWLTEVEV